jgi:hypothetical protein
MNVLSSPQLVNCLFNANTAVDSGGGMVAYLGSPQLVNCTFGGNEADQGGAMFNLSATPTLANCVLWGDWPDEIHETGGADTMVYYSDVQGGWSGPGNVNADPMFVDPVGGDLRLQAVSGCIDAGDNTAVPPGVTTDLDGKPRFLEIPETPDTGYGDVPVVDMGAYESLGGGCLAITSQEVICHGDGTTFTVNAEGLDACTGGTTMVTFTGMGGAVGEDFCATLLVNAAGGGFCCSTLLCVPVPDCSSAVVPCDLDGDGLVDIQDLLLLLSAWGPNPNHPADLNGDGAVDASDFLLLLAGWDAGP